MKGIYYLYKSTVVFKALRNCFGFKSLFFKVDKLKTAGAMKIIDKVVKKSGLDKKYRDVDLTKLNPIGNRVWIYWYTGFETAPALIKKCVEEAKKVKDIDLILLDKNNFKEYFAFDDNLKKLVDEGKVPHEKLANIVRTQLISRHGGTWCDATLFIIDKNLISNIKEMSFYSAKHPKDWHFAEGRWTTFFLGGGIGNPITSFIYDTLIEYYKYYDWHFDYFQFDYIWLYAYRNFDWARKIIDGLPENNKDLNYIQRNWDKPFNKNEWNTMMTNNEMQKLNWKVAKLPDDRTIETVGLHFLNCQFNR